MDARQKATPAVWVNVPVGRFSVPDISFVNFERHSKMLTQSACLSTLHTLLDEPKLTYSFHKSVDSKTQWFW